VPSHTTVLASPDQVHPVIDFGRGWNRRAPSMASDAPGPSWPVQPEWENIFFQRLLAVDDRGTPRDLGRAKFLIADQQVTAAEQANSSPHS